MEPSTKHHQHKKLIIIPLHTNPSRIIKPPLRRAVRPNFDQRTCEWHSQVGYSHHDYKLHITFKYIRHMPQWAMKDQRGLFLVNRQSTGGGKSCRKMDCAQVVMSSWWWVQSWWWVGGCRVIGEHWIDSEWVGVKLSVSVKLTVSVSEWV